MKEIKIRYKFSNDEHLEYTEKDKEAIKAVIELIKRKAFETSQNTSTGA